MDKLVDELVSEIMKLISHKANFWTPYWREVFLDKLSKALENEKYT